MLAGTFGWIVWLHDIPHLFSMGPEALSHAGTGQNQAYLASVIPRSSGVSGPSAYLGWFPLDKRVLEANGICSSFFLYRNTSRRITEASHRAATH